MKKLIILDIKKDYLNISRDSSDYINIGRGTVLIKNRKKINLKKFSPIKKKIIFNKYFAIIKKNQKKWNSLFDDEKFEELEFINSRNDKYIFFNKFLSLLSVRDLLKKKKYDNIEVISDQTIYNYAYQSLGQKIKCVFVNRNPITININFFILRNLVNLFKNLFLIILIKFLFLNRKIKKEKICLTQFPRFFSKKKDDFYKTKDYFNLNFTLSDGIYIHDGFFRNIIKIFNIRKLKNTIPIEKYITIKDIFASYIRSMIIFHKAKRNLLFGLKINNLELTKVVNHYFLNSVKQRLFLNIYSNALKKIFKKNIREFHLFLFEYSIGFYLIRKIKDINASVKIFGYQHGIFSDKLLWFSFLNISKYKKFYMVNTILAKNLFSLKAYKKLKLTNDVQLIKNKPKIYPLKIIKNKYKFNVLIILGTHDTEEILFAINCLLKNNLKQKIFFHIKAHPKKKITNIHELDNRIKIIDVLKGSFQLILCSDTTTISYDLINTKIDFKIIEIENRNNLFFNEYNKKLYLNEIINKL